MIPTSVFSDELYAKSFLQKLRRTLELGWRYYIWDLPRYMAHRRAVGLKPLDLEAAVNPLRELLPPDEKRTDVPDGYEEALAQLAAVGIQLTLPPARVAALANVWQRASDVSGDVIECGCYRGATGLLLAVLGKLQRRRQKVLMLDTFCGSPRASMYDSLRTKQEYRLPAEFPDTLRRIATALGVADRVEAHAGVFRDTFMGLAGRSLAFSFGHIDANLYESTWDACSFVVPRIVSRGAIVFDDYHGPCDLGARLAIDRYFRDRPDGPRRLAGNSAWLSPSRDGGTA